MIQDWKRPTRLNLLKVICGTLSCGIRSVPEWLRTLVQNNPTGSPIGIATPDANDVYSRTFTHGLALVNPSSTQSYTVTLSRKYKDIYGTVYSG